MLIHSRWGTLLLTGTSRVRIWLGDSVSSSTNMPGWTEDHLDDCDEKYAAQCNCPRHCRVVLCPEIRQAWVSKRGEGSRQKMYEGRGDQHAGSKMTHEEEKGAGHMQSREASCENGKCTGKPRHEQNDEESGNVQWQVVRVAVDSPGSASRSLLRFDERSLDG